MDQRVPDEWAVRDLRETRDALVDIIAASGFKLIVNATIAQDEEKDAPKHAFVFRRITVGHWADSGRRPNAVHQAGRQLGSAHDLSDWHQPSVLNQEISDQQLIDIVRERIAHQKLAHPAPLARRWRNGERSGSIARHIQHHFMRAFIASYGRKLPPRARCLDWDGWYVGSIFDALCLRKDAIRLNTSGPSRKAGRQPLPSEWSARPNSMAMFWEVRDFTDIASLLPHGEYDLIIANSVFEHIPEPVVLARALALLLTPGGYLLWHTPFMYPYHGVPHDFFRYTDRGARVIVEAAGLIVDESSPDGGYAAVVGETLGFNTQYFSDDELLSTRHGAHDGMSLYHSVKLVAHKGRSLTVSKDHHHGYVTSAISAQQRWQPPSLAGASGGGGGSSSSMTEWFTAIERSFGSDWGLAAPFTMVDAGRAMYAYQAVWLLTMRGVAGDIVEAGVYKGGMAMMMALAARRAGRQYTHALERQVWLFDTFEGLPAPTASDGRRALWTYQAMSAVMQGTASANQARDITERIASGSISKVDAPTTARFPLGFQLIWNYGALEQVQANMQLTGYPPSQVRMVRGQVENTLRPQTGNAQQRSEPRADLPARIALLRLDTDFYSSTRMELEVLWSRLEPGGLLVVDDYYWWDGARRAVDEWLDAHDAHVAPGEPKWRDAAMRQQFTWREHGGNVSSPYLQVFHLWKEPPFV